MRNNFLNFSRYHSGGSNSSEISISTIGGGNSISFITNGVHHHNSHSNIIMDIKSPTTFRIPNHTFRKSKVFPTIWNLKIDPVELVKNFSGIELKEKPPGWEMNNDEFYEVFEYLIICLFNIILSREIYVNLLYYACNLLYY